MQIKRIHEYKRQLLNALNILSIYVRLKEDKDFRSSFSPITFLFGGKAAPGYVNAKLIIKFINNIASVIKADPQVSPLLTVAFMPNYSVTMAEHIIPAANLSEQISTAGTEASGTGNMKFMCNGALTMGTMDGSNVEIAEEAGLDNIFIFGHTEEEISLLKGSYNPLEWMKRNPLAQRVVELMDTGHFNINEPGIFNPLRRSLLEEGDRYMLFADLPSYMETHDTARHLYSTQREEWNRRAVLNIAGSGKFSSDRTIGEYAHDIWKVKSCPVERNTAADSVLDDAKLRVPTKK